MTTNDADVSGIIDTVRSEKLRIAFFDFGRNYVDAMTTVRVSIRLFHRGITDEFAPGIVKFLERANILLGAIMWDHP